jgi:hypothetical protein
MTLQPIPLNFLMYEMNEEKVYFLFYQCSNCFEKKFKKEKRTEQFGTQGILIEKSSVTELERQYNNEKTTAKLKKIDPRSP